MGGLAELSLTESMEALVRGNAEMAQAVIARDKRIDALEAEADRYAAFLGLRPVVRQVDRLSSVRPRKEAL